MRRADTEDIRQVIPDIVMRCDFVEALLLFRYGVWRALCLMFGTEKDFVPIQTIYGSPRRGFGICPSSFLFVSRAM
jgi:hypothetical protein